MQATKITALITLMAAIGFSATAQEKKNAGSTITDTKPADPAESETNSPYQHLDVTLKPQGGPGQISCTRAYLATSTNTMAFIVPKGFAVDSKDPNKVVLTMPGICTITIRVSNIKLPTQDVPAAMRQELEVNHPKFVIKDEFGVSAGAGSGLGYDIQWVSPTGTPKASRVAYVRANGMDVVEFDMETGPDIFGQCLQYLQTITLTFRATDANGNLDSTPISDRI